MLDRPDDEQDLNGGGALRAALRRARAEAAQQTDAVVDLRATEIVRLELLRSELDPIFAQVPREIDIFDLGLVTGERPRLFVDMVAFVEMGHDRRTYCFMRDGRHGRALIAESGRTDRIVDEVTAYVARRLIERERLLADDDRLAGLGDASARPAATAPTNGASPVVEAPEKSEPSFVQVAAVPEPPRSSGWARALKIAFAVAIGATIGIIGVVTVLIARANGIIPF